MIRTPRCLSKTARARGKSLTRSAASNRKPVPRADVTLARVIATDLECYSQQRANYCCETQSKPNARARIEPPAVQLHQGISFQFDDILNETSRGFSSAVPQVSVIHFKSRHFFFEVLHMCALSLFLIVLLSSSVYIYVLTFLNLIIREIRTVKTTREPSNIIENNSFSVQQKCASISPVSITNFCSLCASSDD